jgi:ABC-type nitrate/sulfonate/bicarbonate transport system substrate-binding protein
MPKFRIQPHVRLQEWVAEDLGLFADEGLDYEFEAQGFAGATRPAASVNATDSAPLDIRSGAFEDMETGRSCEVSAACHWAVNAAASSSHGKMWGKAYSVCESGIFVAADSPYKRPEDLAGVPVGVGYHSGSHYSAIQALEPFLERSQIELAFIGLPFDRVRQLMSGEVQAVNVFGAQFYILEQLGFRKLVDSTFIMGFLVAEEADSDDLERYFRAIRRAQREIDLEPERYKHYWEREMPADLLELVDVRRFGPGERIVFEPYTRDMFERTHRWMESWELFDPSTAGTPKYENAVLS